MGQPRYWIGVASQDHVIRGVQGGFCQLCHGKSNPLKRLNSGDWLVYYSPRMAMNSGNMLQSFTAIGQILAGEPYLFDLGNGFVPYRRDVRFIPAEETPIRLLLDDLSFIKNKKSWGYVFRFGLLEIPESDFQRIAVAMNVEVAGNL
jgi:EVE domain